MATLPGKVQPGDLITSEFMNSIIDVCAELQEQLDQLQTPGGGTKLDIINLLPSGAKRIGDQLHILGVGFKSQGTTAVLIDGLGVVVTPGVDEDKELIVTIPSLQGVGANGKPVTVLVSNLNGSDTADFQVLPAIETLPQGNLLVNLASSPSGSLAAGSKPIFQYTVRAVLNLAERFQLAASTAAGWQCDIVDGAGAVIANPTIDFPQANPPGGPQITVRVQVTIPVGTPAGTATQLSLGVTSQRNAALVGASGGEQLTIGAAGPAPEPITINTDKVGPTLGNAQPAPSFVGGVVKISAGAGRYRLTFNVQPLTQGATYTKLIEPLLDARWTASWVIPSVELQESLGPVGPATPGTMFLFLSATAGAPATNLTVRLTNNANAADKGHVTQKIALT